ncbi:MAG: methyl-accepting chemotaxis protein [Nitrospirales bacterium]
MKMVEKFLHCGIAVKLVIVFVIFGAIPMGAVGIIAYGSAESMKDKIGYQFLSEGKGLADKIDRNLFERYGDVQAFGFNDAITRTTQWYDPTEFNAISQVMNKYVQAYGIYDLTLLVDLRGDLIAVNFKNAKGEPIDVKFLFEQNYSEAPWFKALAEGKYTVRQPFTAPGNDISTGTFIEDIHIDADVQRALGKDGYVMGFSSPVYDEVGRVVAYWSNRANFSVVENMFQDTYRNLKDVGFPGAELTLIDERGRVILDYDPSSTKTDKIVRNFDVLMKLNLVEAGVSIAKKAIKGESGVETALHARKGIPQVGAYTHLHGALGYPGMNWAVLVRVPEEEAVAGPLGVQKKVIMTGIICLALILPLGWWVGRRGANSLIQVSEVAQRAAEGDLTKRVTVTSKDELGALGHAMNAMLDNLVKVVSEVRQAAEHVSTASSEITQGNEDLSQRTSAQAGALEETSASMEEMTSTIRQNADNAKQANQLAVAAREVAEKGGTVTEKAVEAMNGINQSSKKIADIINVIDEIAFQTNLLALNAAVEAARAGEQGRGFAVVASEVRNLAQRSATAAKEIKALINESVQKVGDGSELVNRSGQTLEEIVNSVKRVTDIIAEISAASQEQAAGIDQVNKAVMQMDQGTQQNAALVEQATSASQSMKQQSAELLNQVAFFKFQDEGLANGAHLTGSRGSGGDSQPSLSTKSSSTTPKLPLMKSGSSTKKVARPPLVGVGNPKGQDLWEGDENSF